jgi:four helix bundle protein
MEGNCKLQNSNCKLKIAEVVDPSDMNRKTQTPTDLAERFLDFADRVSTVVEALPDTRLSRRIADQLLRSGTSPLANYEEACAAESKADFAHKLRICLKEVRESRAWLRLTARRILLPASRLEELIDKADQLAKIVGQSIATSKGIQKRDTELSDTEYARS